MTDRKHDYAKLSEVTLHYVTAGIRDPVVLLHGWPQTWFMWRKIIPGLKSSSTNTSHRCWWARMQAPWA